VNTVNKPIASVKALEKRIVLAKGTKNNLKSRPKFITRIKQTEKPLTTLFRFKKYKLYLTVNKTFPKSSEFYNQMFRKFKGKAKINLIWLPGMTWIGPITLGIRMKATENVLRDLQKRNIHLEDIIKNEDTCMDILGGKVFYAFKPKSKLYKKYLDRIESKFR